ncbi:MAG TPA: preprotein translocase subunit SecG [Candidatus Baltobacteraceae bacterium]|nr:preprotein translocase subunit SecG [Candidatus Baltobacteraceae bacterium]
MTALLLAAAKIAAPTAAALKAGAKAPLAQPSVTILPPQPVATPVPQHLNWLQIHAGWATHTFAGLFILSTILLVGLLAVQTTKQEGLSGTLGGQVQSAYGRPGAEQQLKWWTGVAATGFVVFGTILALTGI